MANLLTLAILDGIYITYIDIYFTSHWHVSFQVIGYHGRQAFFQEI